MKQKATLIIDGDAWLSNWEDATCEQKWLEQGNAVKNDLKDICDR